jgi:hypothetical protein
VNLLHIDGLNRSVPGLLTGRGGLSSQRLHLGWRQRSSGMRLKHLLFRREGHGSRGRRPFGDNGSRQNRCRRRGGRTAAPGRDKAFTLRRDSGRRANHLRLPHLVGINPHSRALHRLR